MVWVRCVCQIYYINMTYTTDPDFLSELLVWVHCVCQIYYINMTYTPDPELIFLNILYFLHYYSVYFYLFFLLQKNRTAQTNTPKK